MVVEELLQLLVDKVDGDLLEAVVLKDLKTGNVEHSTEVGLFLWKNCRKLVGHRCYKFVLQSTYQRGIDKRVVTFLNLQGHYDWVVISTSISFTIFIPAT